MGATVDMNELLRTAAALIGILTALMGGMLWLMRSTIRAEVQPILLRVDSLHHEHVETRRRVETLEGRVDRLRDDKLDRGEADARIELALSRVRSAQTRATD